MNTRKIALFILLLTAFACFSQENIALNKSVTASTTNGNNKPERVVDGKTEGNRWESTHELDNQWIQIDLGDLYELVSTKIYWEAASAKEYEVMVSTDRENWTKIREKISSSGKRTDEFTFSYGEVINVRYIQLDLKTRTTQYGFSIFEWEVYGIPAGTEAVSASIDLSPKQIMLLNGLPETLKILSLNNSLIEYNNQNELFNQLASSAGKTAEWTKKTRLGESLRQHFEAADGESKAIVASEAWTHIILQEQSNKPLTNLADFKESVHLWKEFIEQNCPNPNARIVLMLNWPYCEKYNGDTPVDYEADMKALYDNYKEVASAYGVMICPTGKAFDLVRLTDGDEAKDALYTDNRHPSLQASYLAACTMYASLFGETPIGSSFISGLDSELAGRMQTRAWEAYNQHTDIVNDIRGEVRFSAQILDQFDRPMPTQEDITFEVAEGGRMEGNVFISDQTLGSFKVYAKAGQLTAASTIEVKEPGAPGEIIDTYFAEISTEADYEQNFDGIGKEATATLPIGWKIEKRTDAPRQLGQYVLASNRTQYAVGANMSKTASNGLYNFANSRDESDRAIGGVSTSSASVSNGTKGINIYLKLKNTGTASINSLDIQYNIEKYRKGDNNAGFAMQLHYSADGKEWTSAGDAFRTFFEKDDETKGYAETPGDSRHVESSLKYDLTPGEMVYLAWNYSVASGTGCSTAQALALDDLVIQATGNNPPTHIDYNEGDSTEINYSDRTLEIKSKNLQVVYLYNVNGQIVRTFHHAGRYDLSTLDKGVFLVKAIDLTHHENVTKIIN